jgi:hypothetical protein
VRELTDLIVGRVDHANSVRLGNRSVSTDFLYVIAEIVSTTTGTSIPARLIDAAYIAGCDAVVPKRTPALSTPKHER